jgi:RNA polymerase sigma factor (sigma-70 family)
MGMKTCRGERVDVQREKLFLAAHAAGHDRIYRYFRRRTDPQTAEDLCAEVFRIAWEKSGQGLVLSVMVLFGIARNVLRNHERSVLRRGNLVEALFLQRADHELDDQELYILEILDLLVPEEREVLLLTYWDGLTSQEIGQLLQTSAAAIRMRLHRARKTQGTENARQADPNSS